MVATAIGVLVAGLDDVVLVVAVLVIESAESGGGPGIVDKSTSVLPNLTASTTPSKS